MKQLDRRSFVRQAGLLSLLACLPPAVLAQIISRTPPISPFGADSTAEQVTAGLDLSGKTYAITGANSGLGYETMRVLALRGAHVIGIARSMDKAREACASVPGKTTPAFLDLGDFASVVSCAGEIRAMNTPLDGLICNAGIMALPERELVYGMEKQFVVNHLGHFILVNQLMAAVTAAPQGRFVILSSAAHRRAPSDGIRFDDLAFANSDYDAWTAYGHSKLANALCARELARRLSGTSTTANSVHPGVINTNLGRHMPWYMQWGGKLFGWAFMKSIEEGAATQTYVATSPGLAGVNGFYFVDCNPAPGDTPQMQDDAMASRLWQLSEELTRPYLPAPAVTPA
ncbi:MAG: SDR family NAD(P)-dependent oxidoreductase [Halioglobus sp.]|nr:SDR family NAD(P)-dependent oxidoreductase [Halioglobus sp.]MCB1709523.1 SDR family NAD(P)-dependent oxidoreductase [Halioglobus sp.]MCP5193083.1 SDR family NAD(P)-dependent oxidoreductase [Pseudomonadales bacterium]